MIVDNSNDLPGDVGTPQHKVVVFVRPERPHEVVGHADVNQLILEIDRSAFGYSYLNTRYFTSKHVHTCTYTIHTLDTINGDVRGV